MSENKPISFRVQAHHRQLLEERATTAGLRSADLLARRIVLDSLEAESPDSLKARLLAVEIELGEVRKDLSVATEALLAHAGKLREVTAHEWVTDNLKPR